VVLVLLALGGLALLERGTVVALTLLQSLHLMLMLRLQLLALMLVPGRLHLALMPRIQLGALVRHA